MKMKERGKRDRDEEEDAALMMMEMSEFMNQMKEV